MRLIDYTVPNKVGWTEHDKLERFTNFFKIWDFNEDFPYQIGNGYIKYSIENDKYDVNGIFKTI